MFGKYVIQNICNMYSLTQNIPTNPHRYIDGNYWEYGKGFSIFPVIYRKSFPIFPLAHLVMKIWENNFEGSLH